MGLLKFVDSYIFLVGGWVVVTIEKVFIERTRVVNFIKSGGGDPPLCTLHRVEGLCGWVRCMQGIYERFPIQKLIRYRHQPHRPDCTQCTVYRGGPLWCILILWLRFRLYILYSICTSMYTILLYTQTQPNKYRPGERG